jgi:hypothetical protein
MDERDRAERRRIRKLKDETEEAQHARQQFDEALRARESARGAGADLASAAATEKLHSLMVRVQEAYSEELRRMMAQLAPMIRAAANAQAERARPQLQEILAAYEAQVAEMSRRMVESLNIQMASALTARAEIFRETLDQVRTDIEMVPSHLPPTSAPVGGASAPGPQPSVPDRAQRNVDAIITGVIVVIIGNALWHAILWYAQTGTWEFEELLAYFLQVVLQHLDWPLDSPIPPLS